MAEPIKKPVPPIAMVKKNRFFSIVKANFTRGNMVQLAIAFILGTAFSAVVTSLANDIILQAIYLAVPQLKQLAAQGQNAVGINYAKFIATLIIFIIDVLLLSVLMYFTVIIMEYVNRNKPKPIPPPPMASNNDILAELKLLNNNFASMPAVSERRHTTKRQE